MGSSIQNNIIRTLRNSSTIGATTKQLAISLKETEETVETQLEFLSKNGRINHIGRGLWILKNFEDVTKVKEFIIPDYYVKAFKEQFKYASFTKFNQGITFSFNEDRPIHRWSPYVQGFSATFVDAVLKKYQLKHGDLIADPYAGSGTTLVCAKIKQIDSVGVDLMPLLTFMAEVKTRWGSDEISVPLVESELERIKTLWKKLDGDVPIPFLKETHSHFSEGVLSSIFKLKESILTVENYNVQSLFLLAFTSILVASSNLKRSPCLGYAKKKRVSDEAPFRYFTEKVAQMIADLKSLQSQQSKWADARIIIGDSRTQTYDEGSITLAVTSPPYANGLDYVTNYKLEMVWLGTAKSYADLRRLRDQMVACDNISRKAIHEFAGQKWKYEDGGLDEILDKIKERVENKGTFRRNDMHLVVRKYFEDLYQTFQRIYDGLNDKGRFIVVIGDSLIAGTYLPTDLILARIGVDVGFKVEDVQIARVRRSGQRRSFMLRETIVALTKGSPEKLTNLDDFVSRDG